MATLEALESRIETPERRVSEWEGQVGFLAPLVRQLHREILTVQEDVQRLENKVDRGFLNIEQSFLNVEQKFDGRFQRIEAALDALPRVVAEEIARRR